MLKFRPVEILSKVSVGRRELFYNLNFEEDNMSSILPLPNNVPKPSNHENDHPIIDAVQYHNEIDIPFILPIWSEKNKNKYSSSLFISSENLHFSIPVNIFNTLWNDEIINLIVFHTNLYAQQNQMKTEKSFKRTNLSEIKTFIGINLPIILIS